LRWTVSRTLPNPSRDVSTLVWGRLTFFIHIPVAPSESAKAGDSLCRVPFVEEYISKDNMRKSPEKEPRHAEAWTRRLFANKDATVAGITCAWCASSVTSPVSALIARRPVIPIGIRGFLTEILNALVASFALQDPSLVEASVALFFVAFSARSDPRLQRAIGGNGRFQRAFRVRSGVAAGSSGAGSGSI